LETCNGQIEATCIRGNRPFNVGTPVEQEIFAGLVPAPNEAYTSLFWLGDTKGIDAFIKEKRKQERMLQKPAKNQLL